MSYSKEELDQAFKIQKECWDIGGEVEDRLKAKCNWEHMSRTAVILEWGDPRNWAKEILKRYEDAK